MAIQYFARVRSAADHAAFQKVVGTTRPAPTRNGTSVKPRRWPTGGAPACLKMVDMTPAEFTEYCEKRDAKPDLTTFLKFLTDKASF